MRRAIEQILEGNFGYENGPLTFSCPKLELSLSKGGVYEGSFTVSPPQGRMMRGYVTTSDLRMKCLTPTFSGSCEEIAYCFHGEGMEEGEEVKGNFYIISNQGEYVLPFSVVILPMIPTSSMGDIKNLFHFTNLAKSSWDEAVNLFYSPKFARIFSGNDRQFYDSYRGLSAYPDKRRDVRGQNVEEFLIEINKKQKVEYTMEEPELILDFPHSTTAVMKSVLTLIRNGWGYTNLRIMAEGNFLFTEKEVITDDDFLGNYCRFPIYIDSAGLNCGKNYGQITICNSYITLIVPVTVKVSEGRLIPRNAYKEEKRLTLQLMKLYLAFRMQTIGTSVWLKEARKLLERMRVLDEKNVAIRLFQAQLLITEDRLSESKWLLEHSIDLLERKTEMLPEEKRILRAYYFYLTSEVNREKTYVARVADEVEHIYRQDRTCWQAAWLLLFLSEDYNRNAARKWDFIEKQVSFGCTSPIMYVEAIQLLNSNPALLRKLGDFELKLMSFGAKEGVLSLGAVQQFLYLVGRVKEFSGAVLRILENCYYQEVEEDRRILQEICALLIKGGKIGKKYFLWYERGVECELRITKLYEFYMASIDMEEEYDRFLERGITIPKIVLMYFSYQNNLDYERNAFLYTYLIRRMEKNINDSSGENQSYEDMMMNYRGKIESFVIEQIQKGRMNPYLAYLYRKLLTPGMIGEQTAFMLFRLIFAHWLRVKQSGIRNVIVYKSGSLRERVYPLTGNSTWIPLFGKDYTLLFEDGEGNRFIKNVEYSIESLMDPNQYIGYVAPFIHVDGYVDEGESSIAYYIKRMGSSVGENNYGWEYLEFNLYLCENCIEDGEWSSDVVDRALWLAESPDVLPGIRREYCMKVLRSLFDHDNIRRLDSYLERISPKGLSGKEKGGVLRYMVMRGKFDIAYQWLVSCGPYGTDIKTLVRLCSERMKQTDFVEDALLTGTAIYTFDKGKYDGNILRYLADHYRGMTRNMKDIWKAARSFEVDCYRLSEQILVQMMFSGSYVREMMEIFRSYISQGGNTRVKEAFLAQCSYDYFVKEKLMKSYVFEEICLMELRDEPLQKICKLAYLKYYAEHPEEYPDGFETRHRPVLEKYLNEMIREGIYLNFFWKFKDCDSILRPMADKTIVEYRKHPDARARIHYTVIHENGKHTYHESGVSHISGVSHDCNAFLESSENYLVEDMIPVYGGVCFKDFILFFGETLQYYIEETRDDEKYMTESGNMQRSDTAVKGDGSKFEIINDIVISKILRDYDTLDYLLEEYYRKEYLNERLFFIR